MVIPLSLLGGLLQVLVAVLLIGVPIGLYIWLRATGTLGEPSGKTLE